MTNLLLVFPKELKTSLLHLSPFANELVIYFRQIDQYSPNLRKLFPQRFVFSKTDIFKVIF